MDPILFTENLINNEFINKPPKNVNALDTIIASETYDHEVYKEPVQVLQAMIKFAAI